MTAASRKSWLLVIVWMAPLSAFAGQASEDQTDVQTLLPENWLDTSRTYVANSADAFAEWLDQFLGSQRADIESAESSLRLSADNQWEESSGNTQDIRVRGKIHLPRVSSRLSVFFEDNEEENSLLTQAQEQTQQIGDNNEQTEFGLQYTVLEAIRSRLDFRIGVESSLEPRARLRYRYELPAGNRILHRFTETLRFVEAEDIESRSRYDLEFLLDSTYLLRWSNTIDWVEGAEGIEGSTRLGLTKVFANDQVLSQFIWTSGETQPHHLTTSYGIGLSYRQSFYRPWLFIEVEPAYAWKKSEAGEDREGGSVISLRLEVLIE